MHDLIKIIDVSNEILYERASGERNLMSLINVTVSHEMRNPINSIKSQNIKQAQINEKLRFFLL